MNRRKLLAALSTLSMFSRSTPAQAPGLILVGFPPGGTTDGVARLYAEPMSKSLGRNFVVENRPGAGGAIAATLLKRAPADGSTVMLAAIVNISIYPSVANPPIYDPKKDLLPVALVGRYDLALAVSASSGVSSWADYVKWVTADPRHANFGSPGLGSLPHLFGIQLGRSLHIELTHVPFQGAAPSVAALLGDQLGAVIQPVSDLLAQHAAGRIRILATTGERRNAQLPQVPTFTELDYPHLQGGGWIGFFAPARTPQDKMLALWKATEVAAADPIVLARMEALGFDAAPMTTSDFAALIDRDTAHWGAVVKAAGGAAMLN